MPCAVGYPTVHADVGTESCREIEVACLEESVNVADKVSQRVNAMFQNIME